ncbi:hypothetical protein F4808DRAFT_93561 [Astrocystis sublimbata]|nr:hypothetical protein F4808DRAFT_93561 [Astrocystis sublimbata]
MESMSDYMAPRSGARSFSPMLARKSDLYLPTHINSKPRAKFQVRALLGHCLYRRVFIWSLVILFILVGTLLDPRFPGSSSNVLGIVRSGKSPIQETDNHGETLSIQEPVGVDVEPLKQEVLDEVQLQVQGGAIEDIGKDESIDISTSISTDDPPHEAGDASKDNLVVSDGAADSEEENEVAQLQEVAADGSENAEWPKWLDYKHLDGYYRGLRALVRPLGYKPEYPKPSMTASEHVPTPHHADLPKPTLYRPQPDYDSDEWRRTYVPVKTCFVDAAKKVPAPDLYAYRGLVQGQPKPAIGSHEALGLRDDVCFDRFGRYGPYGLGYSVDRGGLSESMDIESEGSETVWEQSGQINWEGVDWAEAQGACFRSNQDRFFTGKETEDAERTAAGLKKLNRTAIVVRTYVGFKWTAHAILNFRAMISELNLKSGGEYDIHFLLHVRDNNAPIWADDATAGEIIRSNVPSEFHGLCTLWSEAQMKLFYPGNFGETFENPSNGDIHGVYRSAHMPLQHFAMMHPEYEHFWNWEMDMRWTGSYYELFDRLGKWGQKQSRIGAWERSAKYYIPGVHGTWDNFTELVNDELKSSKRWPVIGPVSFPGKVGLNQGENFLPGSCSSDSELFNCGVGEEADLITLNPLFDADESGWVFAGDVTGYETTLPMPPRRCSIVTASRLSRRLLSIMHEETWRLHHSMFSEMFPPTIAFHRGLKAVFAPHPIFLDRDWPQTEIDTAFNGGVNHTSGGHGSPFDLKNEHNHKGTTWYYNSEFAGLLWRRWLGYAQMDGRGDNGGRAGEGAARGGREEELDPNSSGRLCLRSMLVHPIKWENPSERDE